MSTPVATLPLTLTILRERRGLTQQDLAAKSGTHQGDISLIENGKRLPPPELLQKLAKALGVPLKGAPSELQSRDLLRPWDEVLLEGKVVS